MMLCKFLKTINSIFMLLCKFLKTINSHPHKLALSKTYLMIFLDALVLHMDMGYAFNLAPHCHTITNGGVKE
jgi:hypothetical protein